MLVASKEELDLSKISHRALCENGLAKMPLLLFTGITAVLTLAIAGGADVQGKVRGNGIDVIHSDNRMFLTFTTSAGERFVESGFDTVSGECTSWYGREIVRQIESHGTRVVLPSGADSSLLMLGLGGGMIIAQLLCSLPRAPINKVLAVELSAPVVDLWWRKFFPAIVQPCLPARSSNSSWSNAVEVVKGDAISFVEELARNRTHAARVGGCFRYIVVDCFTMQQCGAGSDADKCLARTRPEPPSFTPEFLRQLRSIMCAKDSLLLINTTPMVMEAETLPLFANVSTLFNNVRVRRKRKAIVSGFNVVISASVQPEN